MFVNRGRLKIAVVVVRGFARRLVRVCYLLLSNTHSGLAGLSPHLTSCAAPPRLVPSGGGDWNQFGRRTTRPVRVVADCSDPTF